MPSPLLKNHENSLICLLLVEPCPEITAMLRAALEPVRSNVRVESVQTLAEARAWLDENTPDLAVVDLFLPDGKGSVLLPYDRSKSNFPIIFLVETGVETDLVEAVKAGAMDYLIKTAEGLAHLPRVIDRTLRQWRNILRHRLTEDALKESEERFRSIFQTAAAGMFVVSSLNNIIQVNRAFSLFTGYPEAELLNLSILELTLPEDRPHIEAMYENIFSLKVPSVDCERRYVRKDGSLVWGHVSLACIMGADNRPAYCIAMVQDITLRKALEEKLLLANRELDAFVHTVSHDLRSPLTPIIGYMEFILEQYATELPQPVSEMLAEVLKQGERMYAMLEDLLALAVVGTVTPPQSPVCGYEVLLEVQQRYPAAVIVADSSCLPDILMPKTLYLQLLDNLVGNAVQYAGGKPVEVSGVRSGGMVRLAIRDYGPGVPKDEKERIFELFYRGSTGKRIAGTGIGLATVQKIARLHNGRAWVEDAAGGGSIFRVELTDGINR